MSSDECSGKPGFNKSPNGLNASNPPSNGLRHGSGKCNESVSESRNSSISRPFDIIIDAGGETIVLMNGLVDCVDDNGGLRQGSDKCSDSPSDSSIKPKSIGLSVDDDGGVKQSALMLFGMDSTNI